MELDERRLILLDNLIYLDDTVTDTFTDGELKTELTVDSIVSHLLQMDDENFKKAVTDEQFYYCGNMVNGMSVEEWRNVLTAIKNDEYNLTPQSTDCGVAVYICSSYSCSLSHEL